MQPKKKNQNTKIRIYKELPASGVSITYYKNLPSQNRAIKILL